MFRFLCDLFDWHSWKFFRSSYNINTDEYMKQWKCTRCGKMRTDTE